MIEDNFNRNSCTVYKIPQQVTRNRMPSPETMKVALRKKIRMIFELLSDHAVHSLHRTVVRDDKYVITGD